MPIVIAICNPKGGVGKTTTTAFVAHALHQRGRRVLVVDADPQRSAHTWATTGGWPMPVLAEPSEHLDRLLPGLSPMPDVIVIDTPGTAHGRNIVLAAVRAATHVLIPCAPTPAEYERLAALRELLDTATEQGAEYRHGVLLNRAVTGAASTRLWRAQLEHDGWRVLAVAVPRLERYAQAYTEPVLNAAETPYGWAVTELLEGQR
jgi:chromosome partitioning protein